jgi:nitroreductase
MEIGMVAHALMDAPVESCDSAGFAAELIQSRRTVLPKRLIAPGPNAHQLQLILEAAAAAPDHDQRVPWGFVLVPDTARHLLAQAFAEALHERDPHATPHQFAQAREKAFRAPTLLLAFARLGLPGDEVPLADRLVSAGCAIQNVLLMATALGFGSALTSGKALQSRTLRELFSLGTGKQALCFLNIGTVSQARPPPPRPSVRSYVSELGARP